MDIKIGKNIKRFRRSKDITQETMADFLGVSFQTISKWERGDCYPDITMLPSLANFFDISIDELLGMDEIKDQNRLNNVFGQAHEYEIENRYQEAIELLRNTIKVFPNNHGLLSELALALPIQSSDIEEGETNLKEAIDLSERVLANSTSEKCRSTTRVNLCYLYDKTGENQKARDLARILPHIWESREMIQPDFFKGQEQVDLLKQSIQRLYMVISIIYDKICDIDQQDKPISEISKRFTLSPESKIHTYDELVNILKVIYDFAE